MPTRIEILNLAVICPLMAHKKGGGNRASIGIESVILEDFFVQIAIQVVDGIVKG